MSGRFTLTVACAVFTVLSRLLPARFRAAVGAEMAEAFRDQCAHRIERAGPWGAVGLVLRTAWHVASVAAEERRRPSVGIRVTTNARGEEWMMGLEAWTEDLRRAVRSLVRKPGFTLIATLMLAVGIGGTTGIYTLLDKLLLSPLPGLSDPGRLVAVGVTTPTSSFRTFPHPVYRGIRNDVEQFDGVTATSRIGLDVRTEGDPRAVPAEIVSGDYFDVLGVRFARGRGFTADETVGVGGPLVVVASHRAWVEQHGADPAALGGVVTLNGQPFTLVGVAERDFVGLSMQGSPPDYWVPLSTHPAAMPGLGFDPLSSMGDSWLTVVARLADGVSVDQARAAADAWVRALAEEQQGAVPDGYGVAITEHVALPFPGSRGEIAGVLALLMTVVGLLLAIVCGNLANLLLSRAAARRREMSIRLALGSGRARVVRQLLLESSLLAVVGAVLGLALAGPTANLVLRMARRTMAVPMEPDLGVGLFAVALALATGAAFGWLPALDATRGDPSEFLGGGDRTGSHGRVRLRRGLAVGQVAVSTLLMVVSALFARSLGNVAGIDPGFDPEGLVTARVQVGPAASSEDEGRALYREMVERMRSIPRVRSASLSLNAPFTGAGRGGGFWLEGRLSEGEDGLFDSAYNVTWPDFFQTMGTRVVRGRDFNDSDVVGTPSVAIVNEAFAERFWPGEDAVGERISRESPSGPWIEVVGVVANSSFDVLGERPQPFFYLSLLQRHEERAEVLVRGEGGAAALIPAIRSELRAVDPDLPAVRIRTMDLLVEGSLARYRQTASVTGGVTVLALLLAAMGLYGLLSYGVTQRRREIGVRMALGAKVSEVTGMVTREGLVLTLIGLLIGVGAAVAAGRLLASFLYAVSPLDPVAYAAASAILVSVALAASWLPARRASRVDPVEALRSD